MEYHDGLDLATFATRICPMLRLIDSHSVRDCSRTSRRDFLQIGLAGLGGLALPAALATQAQASGDLRFLRKKSVILLFLCGGATQIETFDPKMSAPAEFRSVTGAIPTRVPGLEFGSTYEQLADRADRLAVVRSFAPHGISDHAQAIKHVLTSGHSEGNSIGSRYARFRGATTSTGIPSYSALIEENEVDEQYVEDRDRMKIGSAPGTLGKAFAPFTPVGGGELLDNMELQLPLERLNDRRSLLQELDALRRGLDQAEAIRGADLAQAQAFDVMLGGDVRQALDLSQEDPRLVERYDTSMFEVGWTRKMKSSLGERLLLARRLCQAGCGFVTVGFAGWDNHANGNHPNIEGGMKLLGRPLDKAVSAFLDDLKEQGLSDDILLVITSEFGRTPKLDRNGGRDHWPGLCPLVFAGGGLSMGQVIGESTARAEEPKSERLGYEHLLGVIWHTLFDVGQLRLKRDLPRELLAELEQVKSIDPLGL
jgi:uncharacterized protein (DUF1501 family)